MTAVQIPVQGHFGPGRARKSAVAHGDVDMSGGDIFWPLAKQGLTL